jgi:tetratricopeptide (TPR) repeat protein
VFNQFAAVATAPGAIANNYNIIPAPALPEPFSPQSRLGLLPIKNTGFTGRVDQLAEIARNLNQTQQGVVIQSVVGLGGVGKTQLVTEYVHQSIASNKYAFIAWLDGTQPERAYRSLGECLGLVFQPTDVEAQCIAKVEQRLSAHYPSLLLVWDDVKDQGQMLPYLASAARLKAHCLITSRAQYWEEDTNLTIIPLDVFSEAEALSFLHQRFATSAGLYDEVAAKTLAHTVGYLPLALAQVAAYILMRRKTYRRNYSLNDYLSAYTDTKKELFNTALPSVQDSYSKTVWTTWYLSLEALKAENPQAVRLIEQCAYLDEREIQDRLLSVLSDTSEDEVRRSIEALLVYSLVERLMDNHLPAIKIHQLLQTVIRLHLQEEPLPLAIPLSLPELDDVTQDEDPVPEALMIRRYLTDKDSQWQWNQREKIFNYQSSKPLLSPRELEAAQAQKANPATALRKLVIPALHNTRDHQMIALLLKQLDKVFHYDEKHMEQLHAVQISFAPHVKAVCQHALIAEVGEPDAAGLLFRLGILAHHLKDAKEMQEIFHKILPYYERFLSNHPLLGTVLNNLATAYGDLGDHQKQKNLLQRALVIEEHYYDPEHVEVAGTLNNLATAYSALGDPQEKKHLLQRALGILERYYGPEHVKVASVLGNLATAYGDLGDHQEQKSLLQRVLVIQEHYYDPEHVEVARTLSNLANAYGALGNHQEQKRLLQRALEIEERDYGPEHVKVASTLNNLANAYGALGNYQEQKRLLQRALEIKERYYGPEHVQVASTLNNLATAFGDLGDLQEQKRLLQRALVIFEHYYGPEHREVAKTLNNLAIAYGDLGDHQEQKRLLERVLVIQELSYGPEHVEVAKTLNNLAIAYSALGEFPSAQGCFHRALRIYQPFFGEAHPEVGMVFFNLAMLHFQQKEFSLGLVYLKQAHTIFTDHPNCGPTHPYTQKAIEALKQLAPQLSRWEAAAPQYVHSQQTGDQAFEDKDYPTAIQQWQIALPFVNAQSFLSPTRKFDAILLYEQLGDAYREQGELDKAIANFTQAQTQLTYLTLQQSDHYLRITNKKSACEATLVHQLGVMLYKAGSIEKNCNHFYRPSTQANPPTVSKEELHLLPTPSDALFMPHNLAGQSSLRSQDRAIDVHNNSQLLTTSRADKMTQSASLLYSNVEPQQGVNTMPRILPSAPTPYEYALLSQAAYHNGRIDAISQEPEEIQLLYKKGWVQAIFLRRDNGYQGSVWRNDQTKQIVIAHAGSDNPESWATDFESVLQLKSNSFVASALTLMMHSQVLKYRNAEDPYRVSTTGHSLGGFLAQITTFCAQRQDLPIPNVYYPEMSAVTFDSPGGVDFMKAIDSKISGHGIKIEDLNIQNFCITPTLVSTFGTHTGTIWCLAENGINTSRGLDFVKNHSIDKILQSFDESTGYPRHLHQMANWPQANYKLTDGVQYLLTKVGTPAIRGTLTTLFAFRDWWGRKNTSPGSTQEVQGSHYEAEFLERVNPLLELEARENAEVVNDNPHQTAWEATLLEVLRTNFSPLSANTSKQILSVNHFDLVVQDFIKQILMAKKAKITDYGWRAALVAHYGENNAKLLDLVNIEIRGATAFMSLTQGQAMSIIEFQKHLQTILREKGVFELGDFIGDQVKSIEQIKRQSEANAGKVAQLESIITSLQSVKEQIKRTFSYHCAKAIVPGAVAFKACTNSQDTLQAAMDLMAKGAEHGYTEIDFESAVANAPHAIAISVPAELAGIADVLKDTLKQAQDALTKAGVGENRHALFSQSGDSRLEAANAAPAQAASLKKQ